MSERSFFNLRYALPGYTFILLNLLINLRLFLYLFLTIMPRIQLSEIALSLLGVLFGFLTLMSGSAVGFLVSQVWYVFYFALHFAFLRKTKRWWTYKVLREEFNVKDDTSCLEVVLNYFVHSHKDKGIRTYFNRRWDLMMLFGSTGTAIILGLFFGRIIKNFILNPNPIPESKETYIIWTRYDLIIPLASICLLIGLILGYFVVWRQHNQMITFTIRQKIRGEKKEKLQKEFPEECFELPQE